MKLRLKLSAVGINPFLNKIPILYPKKRQKTIDLLTFSGGIKWKHWRRIG